jgi:DNA helicase IV
MHTATFKGTVASAFGEKLKEPFKIKGEFEAFGSPENPDKFTEAEYLAAYEEIAAAGKLPSKAEIVDVVNNKLLANARATEIADQLKARGIEKPVVNATEQGKIVAAKNMLRDLLATGRSEADAKQVVSTVYGVTL